MPHLTDNLTEAEWSELIEIAGKDHPAILVLYDFLSNCKSLPQYIPSFELEKVITKFDLPLAEVWKPIVDLLCIQAELLELHFRFINEKDDHFEIGYDAIQQVLSGEALEFGGIRYSAAVLRNRISPYFIPTAKFVRLFEIESAKNA